MTKHLLKTLTVSAALLLGSAGVSAYAAGISIGGGTPAGSSASATVGGGNGNVAGAQVGVGGNAVDLSIGSGSGPLATVNSNGNPAGGGSQTSGAVNLGSLLSGIDLSGVGVGGGAGGGTGDGSGGVAGGGGGGVTLSPNDRLLLKTRCAGVLGHPGGYQADVVTLCRLIAKM